MSCRAIQQAGHYPPFGGESKPLCFVLGNQGGNRISCHVLFLPYIIYSSTSLSNSYTPELGTMRCPPRELKEPKAVQDGSRERTRLWVRLPMVSLSISECASLGESLDEKSESSSCGVTVPDELYTLIFRLGRGSSRGEFVMGILSATSWRAYTGPRYMAAAEVRSGGAVRRSAKGNRVDKIS